MKEQDIYLDNSSMSANDCARKYQLTVCYGVKSQPNADSNFGNAVHRVMEHFVLERSAPLERKMEIIMESANKYNVSAITKLQKVAMVGDFAINKLPKVVMSAADRPYVEIKFKIHYKDIVSKTATGEAITYRVWLVGTIDYIGHDGNQVVLVDYKTYAGRMASEKLTEYALKFQLPFYSWILHKFGDRVLGPGIAAQSAAVNAMRAHYYLISHNEPVPTFRLSIGHTYPDRYFDEVQRVVDDHLCDMIEVWNLGNGDDGDVEQALKNGFTRQDACKYCQFKPACITRDDNKERMFVERMAQSPYDPLNFR